MTERVTVIESESEALVIETPGGAEVFDRRDADVVVQEGVQGPARASAARRHASMAPDNCPPLFLHAPRPFYGLSRVCGLP